MHGVDVGQANRKLIGITQATALEVVLKIPLDPKEHFW